MSHAGRHFLLWTSYVLRNNRTLDYLAEIERSQWLSRDEIATLQIRKLRALLVHCKGIPFYRDRFRDAGFVPENLKSLEDLRGLPPLDREEVRLHKRQMIDPSAPRSALVERATGGSGGTPLRFIQDAHYRQMKVAHIYRTYEWCGWRLGDRRAYLWGLDIDSRDHRGLSGAVRDSFYNVDYCNAFGLDEAGLDEFLGRLCRHPPRILGGYASSLGELATRVREAGLGIRVGAVVSSAEVLPSSLRKRLEEAFAAPVHDRYGSRELGTIAFECEAHEGLHTLDEANVVEFESGAEGNVLVTNLNNRTMPLVRYRLGDTAALIEKACSCGRGLGRMTPVRGRIGEYLVAPSGRKIHGEFFTHIFYDSVGVLRFEVVQTSAQDLIVRIQRGPEYDSSFEARLEKLVHEYADSGFRMKFEFPAEMPTLPSGKLRFVRSEVPS